MGFAPGFSFFSKTVHFCVWTRYYRIMTRTKVHDSVKVFDFQQLLVAISLVTCTAVIIFC